MWFERQGVDPPPYLAVDVLKISSLELLRTVQCETAKIKVGDFGGIRRQASEPERAAGLTPADLDGSQEPAAN